jgi:hypothetical protein
MSTSYAEKCTANETCVFPWSAIGAPLAQNAVLHVRSSHVCLPLSRRSSDFMK